MDSAYCDLICEEINEKLQLDGTVSISTITKDYDLPSGTRSGTGTFRVRTLMFSFAEFLQEEIVRRLGSIIEGFRDGHDPKTILTTNYVQRNKAKIRGALSAVTVPTSVASIVNKFHIQASGGYLF